MEGDLGLRSNYFRLLQRTLVAPTTAVAGAGITITGRAWPVPSGRLSLERRGAAGTPWQVAVAALHVGASGNFTARVTPKADRFYRLVSAGMAVSPAVPVAVQPALSLAVVAGHFRATMYPALPGEIARARAAHLGRLVDRRVGGGRQARSRRLHHRPGRRPVAGPLPG